MKDEVKWEEKQHDEEELSGRKMTVNTKKTREKKKRPGKKRAAETDGSVWPVLPSKDQINMQTTRSQLQQGAHSQAQSSVWLVKIPQFYSGMERLTLYSMTEIQKENGTREEREGEHVFLWQQEKILPALCSTPVVLKAWSFRSAGQTGPTQPFLCISVVLRAPTFMLEASVSSLVKWLELSCSSCRRFEFSIFSTSTCLSSWSYDAAAMLEDARLTCRPMEQTHRRLISVPARRLQRKIQQRRHLRA